MSFQSKAACRPAPLLRNDRPVLRLDGGSPAFSPSISHCRFSILSYQWLFLSISVRWYSFAARPGTLVAQSWHNNFSGQAAGTSMQSTACQPYLQKIENKKSPDWHNNPGPPKRAPELRPSNRRPNPLVADNLHQHPLLSSPVELTIENLFPRAEIQLAVRDRHDDLASHHLSFPTPRSRAATRLHCRL